MKCEIIQQHYIENRQKLLKRLYFMCNGDSHAAEDVLQEAYYRALKYYESYDGRNISHWINRIVHVAFLDYKNSENGHPLDSLEEDEEIPEPCSSFPVHVMREIYELIDTKSKVQIEVLNMHFKHEYTSKDIAAITEYSYAKCNKIIVRFREELKELYK